jgi:hypothetical protein
VNPIQVGDGLGMMPRVWFCPCSLQAGEVYFSPHEKGGNSAGGWLVKASIKIAADAVAGAMGSTGWRGTDLIANASEIVFEDWNENPAIKWLVNLKPQGDIGFDIVVEHNDCQYLYTGFILAWKIQKLGTTRIDCQVAASPKSTT